ncbi:hypothetical protein LR48_Vigan08g038400 [Vigna angularis]|uniref:Uncharacterized protein n=2 Tax=Phaseolus angularis TaxID=3914 RepID=A0A0L9V3R9_PHAAN|nr:hypothetical protein LR48_Vigan08g038400 [Vigna angularis]BAT89562.1 hypothetical protein VIGAN_06054400 [Vigna angularis var. angularis]
MSPATPSATRSAAGRGVRSSHLPPFRVIEEKPPRFENDTGRRLGKPNHREARARTPPVAASKPSSHSDSARALSLLCRTLPERAQTSRTRTPPAPQITTKVVAGRRTPNTAFRATSETSHRRRSWPRCPRQTSFPHRCRQHHSPPSPFESLFFKCQTSSTTPPPMSRTKAFFLLFFSSFFYHLLISLVLIDSFDVLSTGIGNDECVLCAYECEG